MSTSLCDPAPEAQWEIWYEDTFDRECPRQVEIAGRGLAQGLTELWARYLFETVQADGQEGFSRFNLWWKQKEQSIKVIGEWEGSIRLRRWALGNKDLLMTLAVTHGNLVLDGRTSEPILAEAAAATDQEDLEIRLLNLYRPRKNNECST